MIVYDDAYRHVRTKYLVPLSKYSVNYQHLSKNNIKEALLLSKFTSVEREDKDLVFFFDNDLLLKSLLGDVELFFIRAILQKQDILKCNEIDLSANWSIVTNYYHSFFCASLMLRLCFRGNIFLDAESKNNLEDVISSVLGEKAALDSNQFYRINSIDGQYVLRLSKSDANTHEVVWKKLNELIKEIKQETKNGSDEATIIKNILVINSKIGANYPSKLRNRINYQPLYGLKAIDKEIHRVFHQKNWCDIFLFPINQLRSDDSHIIAMYSYTQYIEWFCNNLICEYYELQGKENGILKNINKNLSQRISMPPIAISF